MDSLSPEMMARITALGTTVLLAIVTLIVGRFAAGFFRRVIIRTMTRGNVDKSLAKFVGSIVYYMVLIITVVAVLGRFGIETASFVAILGAAGFAVGFALQGSLANFASGVMILLFRPFKVGDFVNAAGVAGSVKEIGIFSTTVATGDNVKIIVPNGTIYGDVIKNYGGYDTRRIDLVMGIGYNSPIDKARDIMTRIIQADDRILKDPAPTIAVSELADSSVNFIVRPWVNSPDYWSVRFDLTEAIKKEFDKNGIDIPYPQQVVHHVGQAAG